MGFITPNEYDDLRSLYTGQLQYLHSTETQIVKGLETMISHAQDSSLQDAFRTHQRESEEQASRLEQILTELEGDDDDKKDPIITALVGSGANIVRESSEGPVRDAGLIAAAQKIEHYEIASYGSAIAWAKTLGYSNHASLLTQSLEEEKRTDEILTRLSVNQNQSAASASGQA